MTDKSPDTAGSGRGIKLALAVSVALNLVVAGMIAGAFLRHNGPQDRGFKPPAVSAFGAPYMFALPKESRREVLRALREQGSENIPDRRARRAMYAKVVAALRASPFAPEALEHAANAQSRIMVSAQQTAQAAWIDIISDMSEEERLDYADRIEMVLKRGLGQKK